MKFFERYCVLMFDEVYLQPNLNINLRTKSIDGLVNTGHSCIFDIADHALVFMLRGINQSWKQPVAFYFVKGATKTFDLKNIVESVIRAIHNNTDFCILATVSDKGAPNVTAMSS